jgi:hypothetical protein
MSSAIISALDEVRGRCVTLKVNFPDTCAGVDPAIDKIQVFMRKAAKGTFSIENEKDLAETLYGVREYCRWLMKEYPEANNETKPLFHLINRLVTAEGEEI